MGARRRFDNLPASTRQAILDAARAEFAREGFERASVNRIAATAKLTKGALYYYFDDKEALYATIMDGVMDLAEASVQDMPPIKDAEGYWKILALGLQRLNDTFLSDPQLAQLGRSLFARGATHSGYERTLQRSRTWVRALLTLGRDVQAVREDIPIELLAEAVTGALWAMDHWLTLEVERRAPEQVATLAMDAFGLVRDMVSPRCAGCAPPPLG